MIDPNQPVLVTGASGFLGRALTRRLAERGLEVVGLSSAQADLTNSRALESFAARRYGHIFHLAAWTQAGDFCLHHPGEQWLINQQINTTVLRFWSDTQPQAKLVSIGTSCTYEVGRDLREENYLVGEPIADLYTYAMTKRMLLVGQQSLARQFGLKWLTVVPSTLYGPGYHADGKQAHFIFDLARKIIANKRDGSPVVLWGDGHQRRELVHVEDFVTDMLALDERVENEVVNIGEGADHSIREFAALLCAVVGVDAERIAYDTARYVGAKEKVLNVEKLRRLLPRWHRTPLDTGLAEMVAAMTAGAKA